MMQGFFDDSGKESDQANRIVCAAGYIAAGPTIWQGFLELWKHYLLTYNMEWLHMKDFMCEDSKEYRYLNLDWSKKKPMLEGFAKAIKIGQLIGFGVALDTEGWKEIPKEIIKEHGTAQEFCFMRILRMVIERMKISCPNDCISVMFDCDREYSPARFQRYLQVRDEVPDANKFLVSFAVSESRFFYPLQAADLLAWETRKDLIRQTQGHDSRPEFNTMMRILPGFFPDYTSDLWSKERIRREILGIVSPAD